MTNADPIAALIADADCAMDSLVASRREVSFEYNERIRKLRDLKVALHSARQTPSEELFKPETVITPELKKLLGDPCYGL